MDKLQGEKISYFISRISSLTILRGITEHPVMKALHSLFTTLLSDDAQGAVKCYHRLTQQLLQAHTKKLCGNMFSDFIFNWLTESESDFSKRTAAGCEDIADYNAFCHDTAILHELSGFNTAMAESFILATSRMTEGDRIRGYTSAVWGGSIDTGKGPSNKTVELFPWNAKTDDDNPLPGMERAFEAFTGVDSDALADALIELYSTYGSGVFSSNRLFYADADNVFHGTASFLNNKELMPHLCSDEYDKLSGLCHKYYKNARTNICLCGKKGMGRTSMLFALAESHTDLRFVYVNGCDMPDAAILFRQLSEQPGKFVLLADDAVDARLINLIDTFRQPDNVMVICTSESNSDTDCFDEVIELPVPDLNSFARYICDIAVDADESAVRNMCMDYQIETKRQLSFGAVRDIIRKL